MQPKNKQEPDQSGWDQGWEAYEREQQRRLARLSLYEKIQWLEQAQEMIGHLRKYRPDSSERKE